VRSRGTAIDRLSGRVFVFVDEAAEQVGALELRIGWRSEQSRASVRLLRWTKCKSPMRPMPVVMAGVDAEHMFELAAAENEESIETVVPDRQYPALGVRVRVRRLDRCADHGDPFALEDVVEAAAELGVAIVDEETEWLFALVDRHQQVARLLGYPGAGRARCAGDELDPAALERDEEKHVDPFQPGGLDGEEITGKRRRRVLAQEVSP
jgi:hypothetical protein